jgi:large subunit ribosomal protein L10
MLEGPTAIAFLESEGDPVAVAKALSKVARETQVLVIRGGIMEGRAITEDDVQNLAKLPPTDVLHAQLVGALAAPMATVVGLFNAPLRDLVGVLQARIEQLEAQRETSEAPAPQVASGSEPQSVEPTETPAADATSTDESASGSEPQSPEAVSEPEPAESEEEGES